MFLNYGDLQIRNAGLKDAPQLAEWWNDGKIMAHAGFPRGIGTTAEKVAEELKGDREEEFQRLIIGLKGVSIGEMCYRNKGNNTAEIGIKICDASEQNKGYGRILLSMLINSLFHDLGYRKIVLDTNLNNKRAQHVYEMLGFQKVRTNLDAWIDQLGNPQSSIDYELKEEDFNLIQ